jgi:uncharacterized membrane protein
VFSPSIFWLWFAGLVILLAGGFVRRKNLAASRGLDILVVLGPVFFAAPLATFGAEHLVSARLIKELVPAWIPFHLFWTYFVGIALLCAALSLALNKCVRLAAPLLGTMFFLFVALIHAPNVVSHPHDRFFWAIALRDLSFGAGAWALAGSFARSRALIVLGRLSIAVAVLFFAIQHFRHPEFAPGVPLNKLTPVWVQVPEPWLWGYLAGLVLWAAGLALLLNKKSRTAAASIGLLMTLLTLLLYVPMLALAPPAQLTEAINYVFDTLLFAGAALLLASAITSPPIPPPPQPRHQ